MTAGFAMLPPLLEMFELSPSTIWRASSLVAATLQVLFILTWLVRRRAVADKPFPRFSVANAVFQMLTALFLVVNSLGLFFEPSGGPFSAGVTAFMISAVIAYMIALGGLLKGTPDMKRPS